MSAPPLLVFDLDGTLADTAPDLLATLDWVLPRHGLRAISDASLRSGIGNGARALIEYAIKQQGAKVEARKFEAIFNDFLAYYETHICVGSQLFPGALALLDRFAEKGWRFAVCTNKPEKMSVLLLDALGVTGRFAAIKGGDSFQFRKPDPVHLLGTIAAAKGAPENSILVGDSRTDRDAARNAGVPLIGVTFGYTTTPMRELQPDLLVDSLDAIHPEIAARLMRREAAAPAASPAAP